MPAGRIPGGLPAHYGVAHGPPPGYAHAGPPPMQYHPGYPPPGAYDPRTGAPVYGGVPPPSGYGVPPGYAQPVASLPPGHGHGQAPAVAGHAQPDPTPADFARERPEAYTAFEQMAIHPAKDGGTEIRLSDGMCRDKHVADFLKCLKCWLWHHQGDPRVIGRPWRIRTLDLSRNGLSDSSASQVMEELQRMDLRIERLRLSGNGMETKGLGKVTAYIWNCPDALLELDLSDNQVEADPDKGPTPGSDLISALLRCFYNHSSYPQIVTGEGGMAQVLPLMLLMGGNRVKEPARLLKYIEAKGGKKHVKILPSPDPYDHIGKEYLSVCLPTFLEQKATKRDGGRERTRRKDRSRSGHGERRVTLKPALAPEPVKGVEKSEKKAKKSKRSAPEPAKTEEPDHWSPPRSESGEARKRDTPKPAEKKAKKSKREKERIAAPASPPARASSESPGAGRSTGKASTANAQSGTAPSLSEEEQRNLQMEVGAKLESFGGLSKEEGSREMLSEFVVCMAVASKPNEEIHRELEAFIGDKAASDFVEWFSKHIQKRKRKS